MIKKILLGSFLLFVFSVSACAKPSAKKPSAVNLDKIVAIVDGDIIAQSELNKKMDLIRRQMAGSNVGGKDAVLRKQALDGLINDTLQLKLAKHNRLEVGDAELDKIISNIIKGNNLTMEQFKETLQEQEGLSFKEYREQLREQILISRVQQIFLGKDIDVSDKDKEVQKVLSNPPKVSTVAARYHVVDVLVEAPDGASSKQIKAATEAASQIQKKLNKGVDVEKIVREYNSDKQKVSSNDLEWRTVNELPVLFAKEVVKIKVGQTSSPIKAPNGLHMIKLVEMQGPPPVKLTKEQAQEIVFRRRLEESLKPWLKELRENAYVKIVD